MVPMTPATFLRDVAGLVRAKQESGAVTRIVVLVRTTTGGTTRAEASWPAPKPAKKEAS